MTHARHAAAGTPPLDRGGSGNDDDRYLSLRQLSAYSGLSVRKLRELLHDSLNPLPCFRIAGTGKVLVRRSEFDAWMAQHRAQPARDVDRIVDEVLAGLGGCKARVVAA